MTIQFSKPNHQNLKITLPLLIIALSLALNLHGLAADSFWGDEILTAGFAVQSPAQVIRWTAKDIHPPLYYLVAGTFARLTIPPGEEDPSPASDWLWRFPSVVAGVLAVAVTYKLATHISRFTQPASRFTQMVAISAALLLAVAPVAIKYSQEARMHALFMFLSTLSALLLFRAAQRPRRWTRWAAFALVTTANIYTMYFGFLILAAQGIFALSAQWSALRNCAAQTVRHKPPFAPLIGFGASVLLAFILYIPWWPVLFGILRKRAAVGAIEGGVGSPLEFLSGVVQALGPSPALAAWGFFLLYLAGLLLLACRNWPVAILAGLWLGLPGALPIILGDPRALQFRYAFVLPLYLTVVAFAVWQISAGKKLVLTVNRLRLGQYFIWILAAASFVAALGIYQQTKPNGRDAATYLNQHATPADIILIGPLWDEGRFIGYYFRGEAQLLTPAALVTNIEGRVAGLREGGGKIWAINRFAPAELPALENIEFTGVVVSEPKLAVYEAGPVAQAAINLAAQAVDAAQPWAAAAEAQGVLNPDPRTARAAALRALGDTLMASGQPAKALDPYQTAVDIFPGWVGGFIALAEAHEATGNAPAAVDAYRQAVAFNLDWQGAEADRANRRAEAEDWSSALKIYHQIINRVAPQ